VYGSLCFSRQCPAWADNRSKQLTLSLSSTSIDETSGFDFQLVDEMDFLLGKTNKLLWDETRYFIYCHQISFTEDSQSSLGEREHACRTFRYLRSEDLWRRTYCLLIDVWLFRVRVLSSRSFSCSHRLEDISTMFISDTRRREKFIHRCNHRWR
jgi:hypothetical protein